jgi:hypothetical protein
MPWVFLWIAGVLLLQVLLGFAIGSRFRGR